MNIYLGLEFDDLVYHQHNTNDEVFLVLGPNAWVTFLEKCSGTQSPPTENPLLRIEQYRQAIQEYIHQSTITPFFIESFEANPLATAQALLKMRDELKLGGLDFNNVSSDIPNRIQNIIEIESYLTDNWIFDLADRVERLLNKLNDIHFNINEIRVNEPRNLLPHYIINLLDIINNKNIIIKYQYYKEQLETQNKDSDLYVFKNKLINKINTKEKIKAKVDGSILILKAKRETEAASFVAQLLSRNHDYKPTVLIPEKNRALDNALIQEGVPSLGILSASLGRPSLQILRLINAFLWEPMNPFKILEFLSLPLKPLDDYLATELARIMAERPGVNSDFWLAKVNDYFQQLEEDGHEDFETIKNQYYILFQRKRYDIDEAMPKDEAVFMYQYIHDWAGKTFEKTGSKNNSLIVLKAQSKKIVEILEALPETDQYLNYLQLERIVKTVYEPSPIVFREKEQNSVEYIYHNSAFTTNCKEMLWWNFTSHEKDYFFSKWYPNEWTYFQKNQVHIQEPYELNQLALWQRNTPFERCTQRMLLVIPEKVAGEDTPPHSLEGDLKACFEDLSTITFDINDAKEIKKLNTFFRLPQEVSSTSQLSQKTDAVIEVDIAVNPRDEETFTGLNALFYYPYQWLFKYKLELHGTSLLSIVKDNTLKGNLAHRFFEILLLENDVLNWSRDKIDKWIENKENSLLKREGAVLLMYGNEPEKIAFIRQMKKAAWILINSIKQNGWEIEATEMDLQGKILDYNIKGKADLILKRGEEYCIVDLKWRGKNWRLNQIKNREDLQLVMYSKLLEENTWSHTAYFIISEALFIARNQEAFNEALVTDKDLNHQMINEEIWQKMEKTYQWRLDQLQNGKIEIRTEGNIDILEELYYGELHDVLEMKRENAAFDDYATLVRKVE